MNTVSCAKCGLVLDTDKAPVDVCKTGDNEQRSIYCPACSELVCRSIGGKNAPVEAEAKADFRPEDEIAAEAVMKAKAKARIEAEARAEVKAAKEKAAADAKAKARG